MASKSEVKMKGKSVKSLPKGVNRTGPKVAHGTAKGTMNNKASTTKCC